MNGSTRGARIRLRTLGAAAVEREVGAGWEQVLGPSKTYALLVYLSACPHRTARREELVDVLWADRDAPRARSSLRQLVWALRQRLGDNLVEGDDDTLTLSPFVRSDRDDLLTAVAAGDVKGVVTAYTGAFLPALALPGGLDFEQWADGERARLRAAFLRASDALVRAALDAGHAAEAALLARRVRDEDPAREAGWRLLLESLSAAGEWLTVAVERGALQSMLAEDARDPDPATVALLQRLGDAAPPTPMRESRTLVADLAGREEEFATLLAVWTSVKAGHAAHVQLTGTAGIGKSRLLQELQQRLRAQGGRVVMTRANPGEQGLPWSLAGEVVAKLGSRPGATAVPPAVVGDLVELAPVLSRSFPAAQRPRPALDEDRRRSIAMFELLGAVADDSTMALLVDDMHWADPESVTAMAAMLHRLDRQRILVVTAGRPEARPGIETRSTKRIVLEPLDVEAVHDIAASIARLPDEEWGRQLPGWLHRASEGLPLSVLAALTHAIDVRCLRIEGGKWARGAVDDIAAELARGAGAGSRLRVMDASRRELLDLMAIAGWAVSERTLVTATGASRDEARIHLEALDRDGLAHATPSGWEVSHDRIRDAIIEMLGEGATRLHARLGRALLEEAASPLDLRRASTHLRAADDVEALVRAARRYIATRRQVGDARPSVAMVAELCGVDRTHALVRQVLRRLPFRARLAPRHMRVMAASVAVALGLAATAMMLQSPSVVLVAQPIAGSPLTPEPTVELRGRSGRRVTDSGMVATVEVVSGPGTFAGRPSARVVDGRAVFHGLDLPVHGLYILRFAAEGFRSVVSDSFRIGRDPSLAITGGTINGARLTTRRPLVRVERSGWLRGNVEVVYSAPWIAASVFVCGTATWGDASTAWWNVFPVTTPAAATRRVVPVAIQAPSTSGRYRILLALAADRACNFVMSGTNWTHELPVWGDGNDLALLSDSQLATAEQTGTVKITILRDSEVLGPNLRRPSWIGAALLDVIVE